MRNRLRKTLVSRCSFGLHPASPPNRKTAEILFGLNIFLILRRILTGDSLHRRGRSPAASFRKCSEFRRFVFACEAADLLWRTKSIGESTVGLISRENPAVRRMRSEPGESGGWIRIGLNEQQAFRGRCRCI